MNCRTLLGFNLSWTLFVAFLISCLLQTSRAQFSVSFRFDTFGQSKIPLIKQAPGLHMLSNRLAVCVNNELSAASNPQPVNTFTFHSEFTCSPFRQRATFKNVSLVLHIARLLYSHVNASNPLKIKMQLLCKLFEMFAQSLRKHLFENTSKSKSRENTSRCFKSA